jgi:hypothetical protein
MFSEDFKKYFIQTFKNGDGVIITTDKGWEFDKKHDFFWNPISKILVIEYTYDKKKKTVKTTCEDFNYVSFKIQRS